MTNNICAPKQWQLTKNETINSFEAWGQNLPFTLLIALFLIDDVTWGRKTAAAPLRGFTNAAGEAGQTAAQKVAQLEFMLGQCTMLGNFTLEF